ncbi:transposon Ty3-I Gag-Pol polyprotein [Trichonephila inaurata madagascariensis]|uniref:Transposon Ty3-I Gag-Pol polyprotein n=1 Tax=Trichonephila inaurata madagascariensis TaxID=2747483 RepID=A0A8X7C7A8_9ARAC|nr:transposon Ty3-I Gag-Pol polyprotein [Trichonephila inaurata madagascariensis]
MTTASKHLPPVSFQLFAENRTVISTYGQKLVTLDLRLRRRIHISTINTPSAVDFSKMAREQQKDSKLQDILAGSSPTSLVLQPFPVGQSPITLHCDVSTDQIRPFVPEIFNNLQALSHPGVRASLKMEAERYVWPAMRQDVALFKLNFN